MTLIEVMIAMTVFTIAGGAVMTAYVFGLRSFQALSNYAQLDQQNREAMDKLSREVRQSIAVTGRSTNSNSSLRLLVGVNASGQNTNVTYNFNGKSMTRTLTLNTTVIGPVQTMLTNCTLVHFNLCMRPPNTNFGYFKTDDLGEAKMVDLTWKTSRSLPGGVQNTENIQTARIVIRKQRLAQ